MENYLFIKETLIPQKLNNKILNYKNLDWRIDVKLATRSLRNIVEPEIVLKLDLELDKQLESHVLQTDPLNLRHLADSLDEALNEIRTNYCRRVFKNII
jgi:COMM domain containing 2